LVVREKLLLLGELSGGLSRRAPAWGCSVRSCVPAPPEAAGGGVSASTGAGVSPSLSSAASSSAAGAQGRKARRGLLRRAYGASSSRPGQPGRKPRPAPFGSSAVTSRNNSFFEGAAPPVRRTPRALARVQRWSRLSWKVALPSSATLVSAAARSFWLSVSYWVSFPRSFWL